MPCPCSQRVVRVECSNCMHLFSFRYDKKVPPEQAVILVSPICQKCSSKDVVLV